MLTARLGGGHGPAAGGSEIAEWADSPGKLALVWIVGIVLLIAIFGFVIKMKMDKD